MRLTYFILLAAVLLAAGCSTPPQRFEYTAVVMAAEARIVLYAESETQAIEAARAAIDRMHALERVMSDYRAESELSKLVAGEAGKPHPISDDLYRVLEAAQELARLSDGAFDVTIGALTYVWRQARATGEPPEPHVVDAARRRVGWRLLVLDPQARSATLLREGMQLDLGGIGKGFAVDEAMQVLHRRGVTRCLVALAGDVAVGDAPPHRPGWAIAIGDVNTGTRTLTNAAISTSGGRYQYVIIEGTRRSHIIDPAVPNSIGIERQSAVTVIAPSATIADGLATALSIVEGGVRDRLLRHYNAEIVE